MSGIDRLDATIRADIATKIDFLDKRLKDGLADMIVTVLAERTCNTHVLSAGLPRKIKTAEHRYQFIRRFIKNKNITCHQVMCPYVQELVIKTTQNGQTIILQMDQSKLVDGLEVLMVSIRVGNRALPVAWTVEKTEGNIGFESQEKLLNQVYAMLPEGVSVMLMGDRFYGTKSLVEWCQNYNFSYRIRIKGNLLFQHEGATITAQNAYNMGMRSMENATFNKSEITTNIGILHEEGHPEPWFIVMDCAPHAYKTLDYGLRWGIESMFSDFKSRGFGITQSHLTDPDRLERLILVLALALYWSTSIGMFVEAEKKRSRDYEDTIKTPIPKKTEEIGSISVDTRAKILDQVLHR